MKGYIIDNDQINNSSYKKLLLIFFHHCIGRHISALIRNYFH